MVMLAEKAQPRLTIATEAIAENTQTIRCLDWDRDRFDIEFGLQNGTTYNSFLMRGEKTALVDTHKTADAKQIDPRPQKYVVAVDPKL